MDKTKQNIKEDYQIFCDLDGVLVDLMSGVNAAIYDEPPEDCSQRYIKAQQDAREALDGKHLTEEDTNKWSLEYKRPVRDFMNRVMSENRDFWMNLPWIKDGDKLWSFIKDHNPIILSKPVDLQSVIGKKVWVKRNLGLNKERVQIRYDKTKYAAFNGKTGLLIDDYKKNILAFNENGGETIHYTSIDDAINKLKEYGFTGSTS